MKVDIAIIGGGIIGSSIAYFLARSGRPGVVAVIEPDSEYALAATSSGAGSIRQLFSLPENIWMSRYSLQFYSEFASTTSSWHVSLPKTAQSQRARPSKDFDEKPKAWVYATSTHG